MKSTFSLEEIFGKSAEYTVRLAALAKQIKKQGGNVEDLEMIFNDKILCRIAKILAAAGRLKRPFTVWNQEVGKHISISFIDLNVKTVKELYGSNCLPYGCRFVSESELSRLEQDNQGLLAYEDGLVIIGQKDDCWANQGERVFAIQKVGGFSSILLTDGVLPENCLFAVTFD